MNLAMQRYFGLFHYYESNIICDIDVSSSFVTKLKKKYPAIYAEYFTIKAIQNKT
jgi:hypothetical protein